MTIGQMELTGDICSEDWVKFFGMSYEDYITETRMHKTQTSNKNDGEAARCDMIREVFNNMTVKEDGSHDRYAVERFYCSDLYDRILALEMGGNDFIQRFTTDMLSKWSGEPQHVGIKETEAYHGKDNLKILDHGAGHLQHTLAFMSHNIKAHYYIIDFWTPTRAFIVEMIKKYVVGVRLTPIWLYPDHYPHVYLKKYHMVNSAEVLEHIHNPVGVAQTLSNSLIQGGIFVMSTFFNSMDGHDPQHLTENEEYQETSLWFEELNKIGLRVHTCDPRGVEKIWIKR